MDSEREDISTSRLNEGQCLQYAAIFESQHIQELRYIDMRSFELRLMRGTK